MERKVIQGRVAEGKTFVTLSLSKSDFNERKQYKCFLTQRITEEYTQRITEGSPAEKKESKK